MNRIDRSAPPSRPGSLGSAELLVRLFSALVLACLALLGAWLGGWPATVVASAVAIVVLVEWRGVTRPTGNFAVTLALVAVLAVALVAAGLGDHVVWLALIFGGALGLAAAGREPWNGVGLVYAGLFAGCLLAIRADPGYGFVAIAFVLAVVWATDSAAYLVGRRVGGPKLWPRISPNKTWSGFVGGLAGGIAAGLAVALAGDIRLTPALFAVAFALAMVSHGGDLLESAIKRHFGVKDASHLIPGHGGMMDRIDGLIFASVAAATIGYLHGGQGQLGRGLLEW